MLWVIFFMLEDKGPLMFINTPGAKLKKSDEQSLYDSRTKPVSKAEEARPLNAMLSRKLKNIIEMYNKEQPVFCIIDHKHGKIEGVPYQNDNGKLKILITSDSTIEIDLGTINDISIVRF